jgi:uncharacterized protein YbjT (DUF2867 family)
VIVRDAAKATGFAQRGAEVVVADLHDERALTAAFQNAQAVYLVSPPDIHARDFIPDRKRLTQRIVDLLQSARVEHVVLLSSIAAQQTSGTGPILSVHNAEQQLRASGLPSTFVRAGYFAENWSSVLPVAKQEGVLPVFFPSDVRVPTVAVRDIGPVAAQALLEGPRPRGVRIIELAGPTDVTPMDVADALSRLLGRQVKTAQAPLDAVVPTVTRFGISHNIAELFRDMYAGIADGHVRWEGAGESVRGSTGIEDALRPMIG